MIVQRFLSIFLKMTIVKRNHRFLSKEHDRSMKFVDFLDNDDSIMKITKRQLRSLVKEAQFGRFTGGAAPLDVPMRDSGPVPKDQLHKLADIYMNDMGMSPEEVLEKPEFVEQGITDLRQLEENRVKITERRLRKLIQSILLAENPCWDGYRPGAKSGKKTKVGKSGKRVANCEKISETEDLEEEDE